MEIKSGKFSLKKAGNENTQKRHSKSAKYRLQTGNTLHNWKSCIFSQYRGFIFELTAIKKTKFFYVIGDTRVTDLSKNFIKLFRTSISTSWRRTKLYESIDEMRADLYGYFKLYNYERLHQGRKAEI